MFLLQGSVIIVEIEGDILREGLSVEGNLPFVVEVNCGALAHRFGLGEIHFALAHRKTRGNGDATLSAVVHSTIEMIHYACVFHHITLVGEHLVVWFRGNDEVAALPVVPVYHVTACSEGVVGIVFASGVERREIKHHKEIAHLHNLCIASDGAVGVVGEDWIRLVARPFLHVVGEGHADALALGQGGVLASGIVIHHELVAEAFLVHAVYGALVLRHALPPLSRLLVVGQDWFGEHCPWVRLRHIALGGCQTDAERCVHRFVARALAADVGHPIAVLVFLYLIGASPRVIDESRESAALVSVPFLARAVFEHSAQSLPVEQVVALGEPRLVAPAVSAVLAVVAYVGHHPFAVLTEHRGTVYLVVVVRRCHHHTIFIWCLDGIINLLHLRLCDGSRSRSRAPPTPSLRRGSEGYKGEKEKYQIYSFHNHLPVFFYLPIIVFQSKGTVFVSNPMMHKNVAKIFNPFPPLGRVRVGHHIKSQSTSVPAPLSFASRIFSSLPVNPATMMIPLGRFITWCPAEK